MSNERLERIKERVNYHGHLDDDIEWLIKRVEELEDFKRNAEQLYKNYHLSAKKSVVEKEELREQNKRYREALEFYAGRKNWVAASTSIGFIPSLVEYDQGERARQELEGESE